MTSRTFISPLLLSYHKRSEHRARVYVVVGMCLSAVCVGFVRRRGWGWGALSNNRK